MPNRVQAPEEALAQPVAPVARPVDTFYTPLNRPPAQTNGALQLADALRAFEPGFAAFSRVQERRISQSDEKAGTRASVGLSPEDNSKDFATLVKEGKIPAGASPWFVRGFQQQKMRVAGMDFDLSLRQAWAQSPIKDTQDPAEFQKWVQGYTKAYIDGHGLAKEPEFAEVFIPHIDSAQQGLFHHQVSYRMQAMEQDAQVNTAKEIGMHLENMMDSQGSPQAAGAAITQALAQHVQNGLPGTLVNDLASTTVIEKAKAAGNPDLLDVTKHISTGSGVLYDIPRIQEQVEAARKEIFASNHAKMSLAKAQQEYVDKQNEKAVLSQGIDFLIKDPTADLSKLEATAAQLGIPETAEKLHNYRESWQTAANRGSTVDDPHIATSLAASVYSSDKDSKDLIADVTNAMNAGHLSKETAMHLIAEVPKAEEYRAIARQPAFRDAADGIYQAVKVGAKGQFFADASDGFKATQARNDYITAMTDYKLNNPKATQVDLLDVSNRLTTSLVTKYAPLATADAKGVEPLTPYQALSVASTNPSAVKWKEQPCFSDVEFGQALLQYGKDQTGPIKELAQRLGVTPEELMDAQFPLVKRPAKK